MTLTIVNHFTHEKTFTVVGEPNGALEKLQDAGYHLNPQVHAKPLISQTDGSHDFSDKSSPPFEGGLKVREPSDFFEEDD